MFGLEVPRASRRLLASLQPLLAAATAAGRCNCCWSLQQLLAAATPWPLQRPWPL